MEMVIAALALYGATLGSDGTICRDSCTSGIRVVIKARRIRFESTGSGKLLASGPVVSKTVENFVERFWFWEKK